MAQPAAPALDNSLPLNQFWVLHPAELLAGPRTRR